MEKRFKPSKFVWDATTKEITIYAAGPLFGIADRHHNLMLAQELEAIGYKVILPQSEASRFFDGKKFDLKGLRENCAKRAAECNIIVANIDGPDADSGTALEVGIAYQKNKVPEVGPHPIIICVRTDFRTSMEQELGVNGMLQLADKIIYKPAFITSLKEARAFYRELAQEISDAIYDSW